MTRCPLHRALPTVVAALIGTVFNPAVHAQAPADSGAVAAAAPEFDLTPPASVGGDADHAAPTAARAAIEAFAQRVRVESMRKFNEFGGAYIEVDDEVLLDYYSCPQARWYMVPVNEDGSASEVEGFALLQRTLTDQNVDRIEAIIEGMAEGQFLVVAVHDAVFVNFGEQGFSIPPRMQEALGRVGIATDFTGLTARRTPYLAIGMKGAAPGEAIERAGDGPGEANGAGTVRYPDEPYADRVDEAERFFTLTVLDDATGEPLAGARVVVQQTREFFEFTTDDAGQVEFGWVAWSPKVLSVTAEAAGKAKMKLAWHPADEGAGVPTEMELRLPTGVTLGGTVVDAAGEPVPKGWVFFDLGAASNRDGEAFPYANEHSPLRADDDGRWVTPDLVPADFSGGSVRFGVRGWSEPRTKAELDEALFDELREGEAVLRLDAAQP